MRFYILHIALIAFIMGLIAPACGMMWGGKMSVLEICTTNGMVQIAIADDTDNQKPPKLASDTCPYCFSFAHLTMYTPAAQGISVPVSLALKHQDVLADQIQDKFIKIAAHSRASPVFTLIS